MALTGRQFARLYFDDLDDAAVEYLRSILPDWRETSLRDPLRAWLRWVNAIGHRDAAMIDLVASELAWTDLQRRSSAVALATLMGQRLAADSPAVADVLLDIPGGVTPGALDVVLPDLSVFRTVGDSENDPVPFEHIAGDVAVGNLEFTLIGWDGAAYTAPAVATLAGNPLGAIPVAGAALYVGHAILQFNALWWGYTGAVANVTFGSVFEYYDGYFRRLSPDASAASGGGVQVEVDSFLGYTTDSLQGLVVRVTARDTGLYEDCSIVWTGVGHTATTSTLLGLSVASVDPTDYELSAPWLPLTDYAEVSALATSWNGVATLPQNTNRKWQSTSVNGTAMFWMRRRIVSVGGGPVGPTTVLASPADNTLTGAATPTTWTYMSEDAIQGRTVSDVLGTTTGAAFDRMRLNQTPYIDSSISVMDVGGDTDWTEITDWITANEEDKVFVVEEAPNGDRYATFGDGTTGQVPPSGQLASTTYRTGADDDGNVGAGAISVTDAGLVFLGNVRNPRDASGWRQRDGKTTEDINRLRRVIPGAYRAAGRAVTPDDGANLLVTEFRTADGRAPFARVIAQELGAGPKSVRLVCVGSGGTVPTAADLAEANAYMNGTTVGLQRFAGVAPSNSEYIAVAYVPVSVAVTVTATVSKVYETSAKTLLESALRDVIKPLAANADGVYLWYPSINMQLPAVQGGIGSFGFPGLVNLSFALPAFPVTLGSLNLPIYGALTVTVVGV